MSLRASGRRVAVAYADCGTYGALDAVCESLGLARLPGLHCYEVLAGEAALADLLEEVPGTYILTDFLIGGFSRLVERSLGLDRHPELIGDYFGHYERIVWLSEHPTGQLRERAAAVSKRLGLPVVEVPVGPARLEAALIDLIAKAGAAQ